MTSISVEETNTSISFPLTKKRKPQSSPEIVSSCLNNKRIYPFEEEDNLFCEEEFDSDQENKSPELPSLIHSVSTSTSSSEDSPISSSSPSPSLSSLVLTPKEESRSISLLENNTFNYLNKQTSYQIQLKSEFNYYELKPLTCFSPYSTSSFAPHVLPALLNWMIDIGQSFKLPRTTLYCAFNHLYRYLQEKQYELDGQIKKLQYIAVACLNIASKYDQNHYTEDEPWLQLEKDFITLEELIDLQADIYNVCDWRFNPFTPIHYIKEYKKLSLKWIKNKLTSPEEQKELEEILISPTSIFYQCVYLLLDIYTVKHFNNSSSIFTVSSNSSSFIAISCMKTILEHFYQFKYILTKEKNQLNSLVQDLSGFSLEELGLFQSSYLEPHLAYVKETISKEIISSYSSLSYMSLNQKQHYFESFYSHISNSN